MGLKLLSELSSGPKVFEIQGFEDPRGIFRMVFQHSVFSGAFPEMPSLMQTNLVVGNCGSIRGFHGGVEKKNHWKVVTSTNGRVRHAFIDIRPTSPTFGDVAMLECDGEKIESIVIPPGFAYGVQFASQESLLIYSTNIEFENQNEISISPLSDTLIHLWQEEAILSEKDLNAPSLGQLIEGGFFNAE
jgi:dTDP-4-dehydrorhamnose 3,5-epimerase-like enzyme